MEFSAKIKIRRLELGMTLEDVSKLAGVSAPTIQRYESGKIKSVGIDKIKALASALKTNPSYLMDWEDVAEVKQSFRYYTEQQMQLLGYTLNIDEDNASLFLSYKDEIYEITDKNLENIHDELKEFLKFKLYDLKQKSRKMKK